MIAQEHDTLVARIAEQYEQDGYTVYRLPLPAHLPFDLGSYRPDVLAMRSANEGVIIEVKSKASQASVDRLRAISETVAEHDGWRFLLVTGDTAVPNGPSPFLDQPLPTWEQIIGRYERGVALHQLGEREGALVILWGALETLLRKRAEEVSIPIERFPVLSLIKHLYSQGELSMTQFDRAMALAKTRNQVVHGFQAEGLGEATAVLQILLAELLALWLPPELVLPLLANGVSPRQ